MINYIVSLSVKDISFLLKILNFEIYYICYKIVINIVLYIYIKLYIFKLLYINNNYYKIYKTYRLKVQQR